MDDLEAPEIPPASVRTPRINADPTAIPILPNTFQQALTGPTPYGSRFRQAPFRVRHRRMTDKDRAADYVLGTLSAQERAEVERAAATTPRWRPRSTRWARRSLRCCSTRLRSSRRPACLTGSRRRSQTCEARGRSPAAARFAPAKASGSRSAPASSARCCFSIARRKRVTLPDPRAARRGISRAPSRRRRRGVCPVRRPFLRRSGAGRRRLSPCAPGVRHPVGRTKGGCMLLVTAAA